MKTFLFKALLAAFGSIVLLSSKEAFALTIGDKAPDFTLNDPSGKAVSLSSLKGKLVLLDFWASWCGYCKIANAEFISIYDSYKSQGFEILSVSLDNKKEAWVNAIKNQNLTWPYHVSDLKGWESSNVAATYSVEVLPTTFLIDENGVIIALDLDEYDLEKKLNWYFNEQVYFYPHNAVSKIFFTTKAKYEIEDSQGKVLLRGKDQEVDISSLAPGEYTIRYEEKTDRFVKKHNTGTPVTFFPERVDDKVTLSSEAEYEIYNHRGKVVKKGKGMLIEVPDLPSGVYYLCIEGNLHNIFKK